MQALDSNEGRLIALQKREAHEASLTFISAQGYRAQAENSNLCAEETSEFRSTNIAGFGAQGPIEVGGARKQPSKIA